MRRKRTRLYRFLLFCAVAVGIMALSRSIPTWLESEAPVSPAPPPKKEKTEITLAAAGDLLMHLPVVYSDYNAEKKEFDFGPVFAPIEPYLKSADYTIANLETRLAGSERGYHGYPLFNTPACFADHLKKIGIDLLGTANNHSLDMGWDGIVTTLDNLDEAGLAHVGTYRNEAERAKPFIVDVKGVKLAFLNYTAITNGLPLPAGRNYAVNLLDRETAISEAQAARKQGADLVVAIIHMGVEYRRFPEESQHELTTDLCVYGVDVVINSHPHVVQPIEKVTVERGGVKRDCIVAHSLGNFVSAQDWRYSDSGIILYLYIEKDAAGAVIREVRYLPVWMQLLKENQHERFRVLPVHPALPANTDIPLTPENSARMAQVWEELKAHLEKPEQGILPYLYYASKAATF
ncbi:MAG: CapA family protein [Bacillota bacterium]